MNHWEIVNNGDIEIADSPEELWQRAVDYFRWCDENPIRTTKTLTSGKEAGKEVTNVSVRPYTTKGLCLHCGILEEYLRDMRGANDKTSLIYMVISRILYVIHTQNAEHAIIGEFNPIFTAKMLNMDKEDIPASSIRVEIVQGLPDLLDSENKVLENVDMEIANSGMLNTENSNSEND